MKEVKSEAGNRHKGTARNRSPMPRRTMLPVLLLQERHHLARPRRRTSESTQGQARPRSLRPRSASSIKRAKTHRRTMLILSGCPLFRRCLMSRSRSNLAPAPAPRQSLQRPLLPQARLYHQAMMRLQSPTRTLAECRETHSSLSWSGSAVS